MHIRICWIVGAVLLPIASSSVDNISVTTKILIKKYGYPLEEHSAQTDDGYILGLHRIPYSIRNSTFTNSQETARPVAFLMHCLLCTSSDWVVNQPEDGLAYILSDAGYDVWLGNNRGSLYSRKHAKLSTKNPEFWNFTWHEMGIFDLPAMLDYIRAKTGAAKVHFLAHSKGTTEFLVLNSLKPEYNSHFKSAHFFAPVSFVKNSENTFLKLTAPLLGKPNPLREALGSFEFQTSRPFMSAIGKTVCPKSRPDRILCENVSFLVAGFNEDTVQSNIIPDVMATTPGQASFNEVEHYVQLYNSWYFRQFDHGLIRNLVKYKNPNPPDYPLDKITVPIFIYYGPDDSFVSQKDVLRLAQELKTVKKVVEIPIANFDHLAFMYTSKSKEKVFSNVLEDLISI